jgi:hypothetical protein
MKITFKKYKFSWFVVFCLTAIAAIIACNLWSLFHGHCVVNDFLRIPPIGWVLILSNIVAGLILYVVKHRKETKRSGDFCVICHTGLRDVWVYCPHCGGERCDQ